MKAIKTIRALTAAILILTSLVAMSGCSLADIPFIKDWIGKGDTESPESPEDQEPIETTYTVSFDTNGAGINYEDQEVLSGDKISKPADPTKGSYKFLGWYNGDELWNFDSDTVESDMTLVAKWEYIIPKYTVSFDLGEYGNSFSQIVEHGSSAQIPEDPSSDDCLFFGWAVNGESWDFSTPITSNMTVTAIWSDAFTEGLLYTLLEDGTYEVSIGDAINAESIVIRPTYEGSAVTKIKDNGFKKGNFTEILIPDSITTIGDYAFSGCNYAKEITIPDSVTSIGVCTFTSCENLETVKLSENITVIKYETFSGCKNLKNVVIPDGVTKIESKAFQACEGLERIVIPDSVTEIGGDLFMSCKGLNYVKLSENLARIPQYTFSYCLALNSVVIPDSVTEIDSYAFAWCESLVSVELGAGVTQINDNAFTGCSKLYYVNNRSNLDLYISGSGNGEIVKNAKILIDKNGKHYNPKDNSEYIIEDDFLFKKQSGTCQLIAYLGDETTITLPRDFNGSPYDIYCMVGVVNVIIPDNFTKINASAFNGSYCLKSVVIPETVTEIGNYAFNKCQKLKSLTLPKNLTTVGNYAFAECATLTSVVLPESLTKIGSMTFYACTNLTDVTLPRNITTISGGMFQACTSLVSIVIPEKVKTIGDAAFASCTSLTSIVIPDNVTTIGKQAFYSCSKLKTIVMGGNVTSVGESAFSLNGTVGPDAVYFHGTQGKWGQIKFQSGNWYGMQKAPVYFYSETAPVTEGNFWYYNENGEITVWQ